MNENKKEKLMSAVKKVREEELVSVITVACFAVYNLVLGLIKNYHFATSIGIYYLLVALTRVSILSSFKIEIERHGENLTVKENKKLKRNGIIFSSLLLVLNIAVVVPIILMIRQERTYNFGMIPAITVAVYSAVKITIAIVKLIEGNKKKSVIRSTRNSVRLIDALVSILTLQNTLIAVNNSSGREDMSILTVISSFVIYAVIVFISVRAFIMNYKESREKAKIAPQETAGKA